MPLHKLAGKVTAEGPISGTQLGSTLQPSPHHTTQHHSYARTWLPPPDVPSFLGRQSRCTGSGTSQASLRERAEDSFSRQSPSSLLFLLA